MEKQEAAILIFDPFLNSDFKSSPQRSLILSNMRIIDSAPSKPQIYKTNQHTHIKQNIGQNKQKTILVIK